MRIARSGGAFASSMMALCLVFASACGDSSDDDKQTSGPSTAGDAGADDAGRAAGDGGAKAGDASVNLRDAGSASTQKVCRGVAETCEEQIGPATCANVEGCRWVGCTGVSPLCSSQHSSYSCSDVDGCRWSYSDDRCSGVSTSCFSISTEFSCEDQSGCSWDGCRGVVTPCSLLTESDCLLQQGCRLEAP